MLVHLSLYDVTFFPAQGMPYFSTSSSTSLGFSDNFTMEIMSTKELPRSFQVIKNYHVKFSG